MTQHPFPAPWSRRTLLGAAASLKQVQGVPSVLFGTVQFDPGTRRMRHGAFALWDG